MIQNKRPSERFLFRRPFIKTDQFGLGHFHTQMAASIVQIKKMILDKPCQTPNVPPTRDSSQLSSPYLCASMTGVTKRWLQAKSSQSTKIHQESEASCRLKKAQAAPKITKPHSAVMENKMPAISPACILGRRRNRMGGGNIACCQLHTEPHGGSGLGNFVQQIHYISLGKISLFLLWCFQVQQKAV